MSSVSTPILSETGSLVTLFISVVGILSAIIEIAPIKVNPWSKLFKWIGSCMLGSTNQEIAEIKTDVEKINDSILELDSKVDSNEMDRIRWEVLDFANSCRNGRQHHKEEFDHIIDMNHKYHVLLKDEKSNGVYEMAFKYIERTYENNLMNNSFLSD